METATPSPVQREPLQVKQEIECGESSIAPGPTPKESPNASEDSNGSEDVDDDADSSSAESDIDDGKLCTLAEKATKFTCEDCGRNYSTSGYLRKHRESCRKPSYHPCHQCEKVLTTGQELRYHLNEHNGERPYVCRQTEGCEEAFHHPRHRMMHEERCGGVAERQEPAEDDEVVVDGMVLLMCKRCGKLCKTPGLFRRHKRNCYARKSCHLCQKEFKSVQSLEYHMNVHTGDKPYKCQVGCEKMFSNPHHRRKHENMCGPVVVRNQEAEAEGSDPNKGYACDQCSRKYGAMGHLLRHKRACHNDGPTEGFVCPVCKMEFKKATRLRYHIYEHTGEKPFKCYNEACTEAFTTPSRRHEHGAVCKHSALPDLRCDVCNMSLKTNHSLRIHKRTHEEHKFVCQTCGAGFHLEFKLRNHMKKHEEQERTAEEEPKRIKLEPGEEHREIVEPLPLQTPSTEQSCQQCKRKFKSEASIQRHLKFCIKTCHLCPAKFHSAKEMSHHLDMHRGEMNFECRKSCGKKFYETRDRNEHEKICGTDEASTDKPPSKGHTCDHCGKTYTNIGYLLRHKRLCNNSEPVTNGNEYPCPQCPKSFTNSNKLRYHLNEHTGETPYRCRTAGCTAAFADLTHRQTHERKCGLKTHPKTELECTASTHPEATSTQLEMTIKEEQIQSDQEEEIVGI